MSCLGLDVGTTELKAGLYDLDGRRIAFASFEYSMEHPAPGRAELAPDALWQAARRAVRAITAQAPQSPPAALAISSQGESVVALDAAGAPLTPFIVNVDSRAEAELRDLRGALGDERLFQITGLPPSPMCTLPKLMWLRKHSPGVFDRVRHFRFVQDYLLERLGAAPGVDRSLASRALAMDIRSADWSEELLAAAGVERERFSPVVASDAIRGEVAPAVADDLGLPRGTLCVAGGHDQACCNTGAADMCPGSAADVTGTFECLSQLLDGPQPAPGMLEANLSCEPHTVPGRFFTFAYVPAGAVLRWFRDEIARDVKERARCEGKSPYELLLAGLPDEPTGLMVFPYVLGTGTPWLDSEARACIVGYSQDTTREHLVKAALEGVCYEMRVNLEALRSMRMPVSRIYATGGGARSREWLQLKADIYGCEIVPVDEAAGCLGAALCAAVGSGQFRSWDEAIAATRRRGRTVVPRAPMHERYSDLFGRYRDLQRTLYRRSLEH